MMLNYVIRHWVMLFAREKAGPEGFGREIQWIATLFYVENVFFASPWLEHLQEELYVLKWIFDWVGLRKNVTKPVGMFFQLLRMVGGN